MTTYLATGTSGHLGEALARTLHERGDRVVGLDRAPGPYTNVVGSVADPDVVARATRGVDHVLHAATLHKPHVGTHSRQDFVDVNVTGTLTVLQAAREAGVRSVVFTSSTSAFGRALTPAPGEPAAWITEDVSPVVRNVYGATKVAAEDLCELAAADGLPVIVLRTSRFFPEPDDRDDVRAAYDDTDLKVTEYLYRRVDLADVVDAHLLAAARAPDVGFRRYIVSATTPFTHDDVVELAVDAPAVVARRCPEEMDRYRARRWRMLPTIDRVYVNQRARDELGWTPRYDFRTVVENGDPFSTLARTVGAKGYHDRPTGVYTR